MKTIDVFGKPFEVHWQSRDRRQIASREKCYELVSFPIASQECKEADELRKGLPKSLERCWLVNPYYVRNELVESGAWFEAGYEGVGVGLPPEAFAPSGAYLPPEARGLPVEPDESLEAVKGFTKRKALSVYAQGITRAFFCNERGEPSTIAQFKPGIEAVKATFENGEVLFLREVVERDVPGEAKAQWQTAAVLQSTEQVLRKSTKAQGELESTRAALDKAQAAASLTLREALDKWMRFDPPRMAANTKARIEKAVKLYTTLPDKRSLAKIGAEFHVSRKTVSTWFKRFTEETGFPVVIHRRHESVKSHLRAEAGEQSGALAGGSGTKTPVRGSKENAQQGKALARRGKRTS